MQKALLPPAMGHEIVTGVYHFLLYQTGLWQFHSTGAFKLFPKKLSILASSRENREYFKYVLDVLS